MLQYMSVLHPFFRVTSTPIYGEFILFIHPFTDGQLDCFPTLASMKNAAINICVQLFSRHISTSLGYIPRSGITQSYVTMFNLRETSKLFSKTAASFYISAPALHEGSNFSTSSSTLVIPCLFDNSHPSRCEVVFYYGFD